MGVFDAAVIGAGIGGLAAAKELSDSRRVVLLEKLPRAGGTAYSFRRDGYTFLTGPLGFSFPRFVNSYLEGKGLGKVRFMRKDYQLLAGELDIVISRPLELLEKELKRLYPEENIERATSELKRLIKKVRGVFSYPDGRLFSVLENRFVGESLEEYYRPASDFFSDFVQDEALVNLFSSQGVKSSEQSAIASAYMWDILTETGIWYPEGGIAHLVDILYREVKKRAELSTHVKRISRVEGGYRIETGEGEIFARAVISNADYKKTFLELADESFAGGFVESVKSMRESGSVFTLYLGADLSGVDASRIKAPHLLYYPYLDGSADHLAGNMFYEKEVEIAILTQLDRSLAPPGRDVVVVRSPLSYERCLFPTKDEYYEFKEKASEELLEVAEVVLPGLRSAVEVKDASTPLTYEVWGGRYRGAVAGWSWSDAIARSMVTTPFENFYMAGIYSFSIPFLGGFASAMYGGLLAAEMVKGSK